MLSVYKILFLIFSPFLRGYFYARCLYGKDKIECVRNHFGIPTLDRPDGTLIWIHAASIGESISALTYIHHVKKQFPEMNVLLTTVTVTSAEIAIPKITEIPGCFHQFAVADSPFWVKKFLNYWRPEVSFFMESEIWPSMIDELYRRKIPFFLLNARLSSKSFERWKRVRRFLIMILQKFTCILAQSEIDYQRFSFFSHENTKRIDNLKYANEPLSCDDNLFKVFKKICKDKKILVAASTHEEEENIILEAHKKLKNKFDLITIIIPRHLTRINRICETLRQHNITFSLRSENPTNYQEVFCIDTYGETGTFFRLADLCFIGGSLVPIGGHNIYEPVALGKPVLHGPFMDNALAVRNYLRQERVALEVKNADDIVKICDELLSDSLKLAKISSKALKISRNESLKQIDNIVQLPKTLGFNSFFLSERN